jgi:hypothetical protein
VTRTSIGATGTKTFDQRYPAAGTPNAEVSIWIVKADGSGKVQVDLGPDKDIYVTRVDWAPGGKALYVQRQTARRPGWTCWRSTPPRDRPACCSPKPRGQGCGSTSPTITASSRTAR